MVLGAAFVFGWLDVGFRQGRFWWCLSMFSGGFVGLGRFVLDCGLLFGVTVDSCAFCDLLLSRFAGFAVAFGCCAIDFVIWV